MRILVFSSLVSSLTLLGSLTANAENGNLPTQAYASNGDVRSQWHGLSTNEQFMLDRVAADFYEADLRLAQSRQIEASTAAIYIGLNHEERAIFRDQRRTVWDKMRSDKRQSLRNVKWPSFANLTEAQKAPFRQIALEQLAPARANMSAAHAESSTSSDI